LHFELELTYNNNDVIQFFQEIITSVCILSYLPELSRWFAANHACAYRPQLLGDRFSGSTGTQLIAALRFLDLIDINGFPTVKLRELVGSKGPPRTEILKQITQESYSFFFLSQVDPHAATYAQLEESFHGNYQIASDVARKCIKFFISLASDSGIKVSPFVTKKTRNVRTATAVKKTSREQDKKRGLKFHNSQD
jgi:hypothetical protein